MKGMIFALVATLGITIYCANAEVGSNNARTIRDVAEHFAASGLTIQREQEKIAAFIGAMDGRGFQIDGSVFEVYKYDIDVPVQAHLLEKYSTEGMNLMGQEFVPVRNGSFLLLPKEDRPSWGKVREAFVSF